MKKRILSLALALAMALTCAAALTGCGGGSDAKDLIGDWQTEIDMTSLLTEELSDSEFSDYLTLEGFVVKVDFSLREDNTYSLSLNSDSMVQAVEGMKGGLRDGMRAYLSDMMAAQGLDGETDLDSLLALAGIDIDALIDEALAADDIANAAAESLQEGKYIVKAGKIFVSDDVDTDASPTDEALTYTLENGKLTLVETSGDAGDLADYFPMTFSKR